MYTTPAADPGTFGRLLHDSRVAHSWTIDEVAEMIGTSRQTIISWEKNRHRPRGAAALRLCELYGLEADEFLALSGSTDSISDQISKRLAAVESEVNGTRQIQEQIVETLDTILALVKATAKK